MGLAMAAGVAPYYIFVHDAAHRKIKAFGANIRNLGLKMAGLGTAVLELFVEKANAPDTAAEADRNRARRDRLSQRVRQHKDDTDPAR